MNTSRSIRLVVAAALLASVGCGSGTSGTGTLVVQLTDAPTDSVKSIIVTIDSVTAHSDQAGWVNVFQGPLTVDLLTLKDVSMKLGEVTLPVGTVSQVRFQLVEGGPSTWCSTTTRRRPSRSPAGPSPG